LFLVPARKLHPSTKLTFDQLALVETLAIGCHAVDRAAVQPGENVLIIGAGPIGLSVIEFVKLAGGRAIVLDLNEQRLDFVRESIGIPDIILNRGDGAELETLKEQTEDKLCQVVVDATGSSRSMCEAYRYVGFTGRLVFLGITDREITFTQALMHRREMTFLASRNAVAADFRRIIGLIEEGRIDTRKWITHHAAFEEMIEAFPVWMKPEMRVIKAIVAVDE